VYIPGKQGSLQPELMAATRRAGRIPYLIAPAGPALLQEVASGRPVLVLQNLGFPGLPRWHYAVVVGYDPPGGTIVLRSGERRRRQESPGWFFRSWQRAGNWGLVAVKPGEIPVSASPARFLGTLEQNSAQLPPESLDQAFAAALARWPEDELIRFGAAAHLHRRGNTAAAEELYRSLLARNPGHVGARNNLAQILLDRGCPGAARAEAEIALRLAQRDSRFLAAVQDTVAAIERGPQSGAGQQCP
jgi:hypothetical protein